MSIQPKLNKPHILFLFSDTGGGHRSAAEAIIEALNVRYENQYTTEMVDIFKKYAPLPLKFMPNLYPQIVRMPHAWLIGYRLSDGARRSRLINESSWPYIRKAIRSLVNQHPSDLIVSVHPLAVAPTLRALGTSRPRFVTVVTDLVSTHAFWYHRGTDLCLVPTETARQKALRFGLSIDQIRVVGLPVANRFCQPSGEINSIRRELNWPVDIPVILLVGGGEGMGPVEKTSQAIANSGLPIALVIIAGRNEKLRNHLQEQNWPIPTKVYGFVKQMPEFMRAADVLVTKAGPGTISEALNAGLPLILYSRLPGQEEGNVDYVVSEGAGVWAPKPELVVHQLRQWILHPETRSKAIAASLRISRPNAAFDIADIIVDQLKIPVQA
jgi:1,2-diacylglycerol 3-beta-galactosyltransferase